MVEDCGGGSQALAAARGAAIRYAPSLPSLLPQHTHAPFLCIVVVQHRTHPVLLQKAELVVEDTCRCVQVLYRLICDSVKVQQPKNGVVNTGHIHLPAHQFLLNIGLVGWLWSLDYCHRRGTTISVAFPKEDISVSFWVKFQECSQAGNLSSTEQVCQR